MGHYQSLLRSHLGSCGTGMPQAIAVLSGTWLRHPQKTMAAAWPLAGLDGYTITVATIITIPIYSL